MKKHPSSSLILRLKRDAKRQAKTGTISHSDALEAGAREAGYENWHALNVAHAAVAHAFPVDPDLPTLFDQTPNENRSLAEIARWWDRPYALSNHDGTYTVRCLDGGAWDRSTNYGRAATLEQATQLAAIKLEAWRAQRMRPCCSFDSEEDPALPVALVRFPQRPHRPSEVLARFATPEEARDALKAMGYE